MTAPTAPSGAAGREKILNAALHLFSHKGFAATTTKEIASRAGVAAGLLFYHFKTKREILDAILAERSLEGHFADMAQSIPTAEPTAAMVDLSLTILGELRSRIEVVRVAFHAWLSESEGADGLARLADRAQQLLATFIARAYEADAEDHPRHAATAELLFSGLVMHSLLTDARTDREFVHRIIEDIVAPRL